jgi:heme oxygenase
MLSVVAVGCGLVLGLAGAHLAAPFYWKALARYPLGAGRPARLFWRVQRVLLARAGYHRYLVECLEALERAPDAEAQAAARARLNWWCALRKTAR